MIENHLEQSLSIPKAESPIIKKLKNGARDFKNSIRQYPVWLHLGWVEVKQRYRRSLLGPWWITLSMLIFITMMGVVFSRLFHQSLKEYIPFFTAGYLFWIFISSSVSEAAEIFKSNGAFIKQINLPFTIYVLKHIVRQVIFLAHNAVVYFFVCIAFKINPGKVSMLALPGFILLLANVYWVSFLIAIICVRFRDMVQIISSCIQVAFFITPISWMPRLLENNPKVLKYNPLVYLLDMVRTPLLGGVPHLSSYIFSSVMAVIGLLLSFFIFSMIRSRIAYWVD